MEYLDEIHGEKPRAIDVYADSSRLTPGKSNPRITVGWGGHVVEHYAGGKIIEWTPSAPLVDQKSSQAEIMAAIHALHAVRTRLESRWSDDPSHTSITLYTDQKSLPDQITKATGKTDSPLETLAELVREMGATITYASHHKPSGMQPRKTDKPGMEIADHAASVAAWTERLKQQGVVNFNGYEIRDDAAGEGRSLLSTRSQPKGPSVN